jgi:PAS domain S-box-containing protein
MADDDGDDGTEAPAQERPGSRPTSGERALTPSLIRVLGRVMDTIPAQINVKDSERRYIFVNRYLYEYYNDQPDYVIGRRAEEIMPTEAAEAVNASDLQVLESRSPTGMREWSDTDLQGRPRHWLIGKWPLLDRQGAATNIVTVAFDITELHEAREAGAERIRMMQRVATQAPLILLKTILWPDGRVTIPFLEGRLAVQFGIDKEAVSDDPALLTAVVHPDDRVCLLDQWYRAAREGHRLAAEFRAFDTTGEMRWLSVNATQRREEDGRIIVDEVIVDVTDQKRAELELQRERELFQSVASHLPGLIFRRTITPDGATRYDYIEGALLDRLAVDRAQVRRDPAVLWEHFESATGEPAVPTISGAMARLEPYRLLLRCRPAGSREDMFVEVIATPRGTDDGIVIDGIAVDVTARLRAESEAREQRMLLQQVIDAVPAAINVKNRTGRIELANQTLADYYGVTPRELLGDEGQEIQDPPQDETQTCEWDEAVLRTGEVSEAREYAYVDRDGRTRHWLGRKSPLRNPVTGAVDRIVTVSLDVTDRVLAEERARQHVEMLRSVASSIPGAVLRWRCDGDRVTQEFAAGRLVAEGAIDGTCEAGAIASVWPNLVVDDAAALVAALGDPAGGRGVLELELRMRAEDETRWIKLFGSHRIGAGGEPAWDIIVLDATESKRYEEQLRIAQKMDAIGNLTGGIAHDFNNILAIIVANLDLLLDLGLPDGESSEVTHSALRAAERGAELTGRLLAFARNQPTEPRVFDCDAQIEGFASFMRRSLGPGIVLDLRRGAETPRVNVDPGQFENALMNLVVNARDAVDGRGRIVIESEVATLGEGDHLPASLAPGRYAVIAVSDSGSGMTPDVQRRAFEPLFTTKSQGRGTGFGLPMVYNFAKQAGGLVTLYSEPGHGTTARIYLPCADGGENTPPADGTEEHPLPVATGDIRILLVDDNAEARSALARQLARQGFQVVEAEDAAQALALAERETAIDLLITDVIMPGTLNGAELADRLHEKRPDLPILLTTGYSSDVLAERQLARGRYEMLGKPFRERDLLAAVARLLGDSL